MTLHHLLILARGDARTYCSADGGSLLDDLPFEVTLFTDHGDGPALRALEGEHEIFVVRWNDGPEVTHRAAQLHTAVPFTEVAAFDEGLVGLAAQIRGALGLGGMSMRAAELFHQVLHNRTASVRARATLQ